MHDFDTMQTQLGSLDPNDMYRALVEQLPALAYLVRIDPAGQTGAASPTIYISRQVEDMLGFSPAEWLADPCLWIQQLHPEDKDRVMASVQESNRLQTDFELEYRVAHKNGRYINVCNTARTLQGTDGAYYTEGLMFDITPRKRHALRDAVLAHCTETLRSESDIPAMGAWLRDQLDEVLPGKNLMLAIKNPQTEWISFPVYFDELDAPALPRPPAHSLIDYVFDTNRSLHWQRPGDREAFEKAGYSMLGTPSSDWMGVPIPVADQARGVIALQIYKEAGCYVAEDLALLESIAAALGHLLGDLQHAEETRRLLVRDELLASISGQAMDATDVEAFLTAVIEEMGRRINVSRSYLFEVNPDTGTLSNSIEWCAPGITPQKDTMQNLPADHLAWYMSQLKRGEAIAFREIHKIPDKATREEMMRQDIVSQISVPLFVNGDFHGFIGFDECRAHRDWPERDLPILMAIARILTHVIERERLKTKQDAQMKELQRWLDITMGREMRVLELKQEVNDLLLRLNESPRYTEF